MAPIARTEAHLRAEAAPSRASAQPRELYIDHLRSALTALVLFHHAAIAYGSVGAWYLYELHPSPALSSLLLTLFCATNQSYFMGFFFLLAGYFTPSSLQRKGYAKFLGDRLLRLGLPLLAYFLFLNPFTGAMVSVSEGGHFGRAFLNHWRYGIWGNGPLWFVQALLLFSLAYCLWRAVFGPPLHSAPRAPRPVPAQRWWLFSAFLVGAVALAVRQFVPTGVNVFGLQLGYFSSYTFLFALGCAAQSFGWLRQLTWAHARPWIVTAILVWPTLVIGLFLANRQYGPGKADFGGGFSWPSVLYAFWEPFVAWGIMAFLLLFARARFNQPSPLLAWLDRRAYAVYILHPPVLVGLTMLLLVWHAPPLLKFPVTGTLACILTWLVADPFVRLPGFRRVV